MQQPSEGEIFGELLRVHRRNAGLTQEGLAERAGLSRRGIADLERGARQAPYAHTIEQLAAALGLNETQRASLASAARRASPPSLRRSDQHRHNLPLQTTQLLGRKREVAAAHDLLFQHDVRLLTLTGPGGTGKTRLALEVAANAIDQFESGVWFVVLAPITDPELVASTIAQTLGVRDQGRRPVLDTLQDYLRGKHVLLVLDNFEQVLVAAPLVNHLLRAGPGVRVLVTSREPLHVQGEREFPVAPLALPGPKWAAPVEELSQFGAVALFIERARAIRPDFSFTNGNARAVAEICVRLDGLPLAIELAAARIRLLSPQAMVARLEHPLPLLTGGAQDLPARQRTLRATMAWSCGLLDEQERNLFRRLSIFVGGCSLEAAQAVGNDEDSDADVLDGLASLVAKNLLRQEDGPEGEPRFGMLETIREYGLEQLEASGEFEPIRRRHAAFFLALAEEAEPKLLGHEQLVWLRRLGLEHDNLRAVLGWSREGLISHEVGLRLAGALGVFWSVRGFAREALAWARALLTLPGAEVWTSARARTLYAAARAAPTQSDDVAMPVFAAESVAIFRAVGDAERAGRSLALTALPDGGPQADYAASRTILEESAAIAREVGDGWGLAFALSQLGAVVQFQADLPLARALREESAILARAIGDRFTLGVALNGMALLARLRGDHDESMLLFKEALVVSSEIEDAWIMPRALNGLAGASVRAAAHEKSARLFGAAEAFREASGTREVSTWRAVFDPEVAEVRAAMGEPAFAAAWAEGRLMSVNDAVMYALG